MQLTVSAELTTITCPHCAGVFAIAQEYIDESRRLGSFQQMWACPYCKQERGYGKSQHQIEKENLEAQIKELEHSRKLVREQRDSAQLEAEHFRKSRDGIRGVLTKQRKRIGNGVCPCCHRTVKQLAEHMKSKHPNFANSQPAETKQP